MNRLNFGFIVVEAQMDSTQTKSCLFFRVLDKTKIVVESCTGTAVFSVFFGDETDNLQSLPSKQPS